MLKVPAALVAALVLNACDAAEPVSAKAGIATEAQLVPYNTQLFGLLINKSSPVDGKNHYQKKFDQGFDALLAQSQLAKASNVAAPLKKRLLSGPQPDAAVVTDKASGRTYLYYEACQAHACDDTNLALLYAPATNSMRARLHIDGKDEYLGNPDAAEKALLAPPKATP
jgi:hypothetical protein